MIVAGIDIGARYTKLIFLDDKKNIVGLKKSPAGYVQNEAASKLIAELCKETGIVFEEIEYIMATGEGKNLINFSKNNVSELLAIRKAVTTLFPEVRTIIEVGAEESKAVKIDSSGKVVDTVANEKCAAGSGAFTESMARTLEMTLEEFAQISMESEKKISMNAQCTVFAESEVVSLIHSGVDKKDIAKAVNDAIAGRVASMARRLTIEPEVILIGGMAKNIGFVTSLKNILELDNLIVPENPEYITAYGAALLALNNKVTSGGH